MGNVKMKKSYKYKKLKILKSKVYKILERNYKELRQAVLIS